MANTEESSSTMLPLVGDPIKPANGERKSSVNPKINPAMGLPGLAPTSCQPMRRAIIASRMPNTSHTSWVSLNVKTRCAFSGSLWEVRTFDTLFSVDILSHFLSLAKLAPLTRGTWSLFRQVNSIWLNQIHVHSCAFRFLPLLVRGYNHTFPEAHR